MAIIEYECEMCHEVFKKVIPDEEADAEAERLFGVKDASKRPEDFSIVCTDCFNKLMV